MTDEPVTQPHDAGVATASSATAKPKTDKELRAERLAEALRSNLKRRKQAARAKVRAVDAEEP